MLRMNHSASFATLLVALMGFSIVLGEEAPRKDPREKVSYYRQIRPIFQANCQGCHQPAKPSGAYVMTSFTTLSAGGESEEPAIVAGKPEESYLLAMITPQDGESEMPQGKAPLEENQIALIRRWILEGATDDTPEGSTVRYDMKHPPVYTSPPVITSLDFSPDGKLLAVAGYHEVLLHQADGSGLIARLVGMSERIEAVRFSPDGKLLAVTGGLPARMGEVQVWDVAKRELKLSVPVTFDTVYGACWSPDGKLISFGCADNSVRVIEAATGKQVLFQGAHSDWPLDTVFSAKGTHLVSVGKDRSVKLTEVKTERFIDNVTSITPGALSGGVLSIARHPTKDEILVGGADGAPKLYRIFRQTKRVIGDDANLIRKFPALKGRVFSVAISRDGSRIAAGSSLDGAGEVRIYAYAFDTNLPKNLLAIVKKRSSQRSAKEKEMLAKYRTKGVKVVAETALDKSGVYAVAFHPSGKIVAAAGSDGAVRLIAADSGSIVKSFIPVPIDAAASPKSQGPRTIVIQKIKTEKETLHASDKIVSLEVQPDKITIHRRFDTAQFIVIGRLASGDTLDVTRMVQISSATGVVAVSTRGLVRAKANGRDEVRFTLDGKSTSAQVQVEGVEEDFPVDFIRDVMPLLGKVGCNAGTCHGSKNGKGGFKLSLRGNDPIFDARAFTDDLASRRVNLASPENSLMLLKSTASVPHVGGQAVRPNSPGYEIIRKWIVDGAKIDRASPKVASIEIFPKNPIVQRIGGKQQFRVLATYRDGQLRDVTAESYITSGDTDIVAADSTGLTTALRRGEGPILARYESAYAATILTVMGDRRSFVWNNPPANNFIDELVLAKLLRTKTLPSEICTDAEFIRRVFLDLTGLPPTASDVQKFLADKRDSRVKRDELIDRLVGSEAFLEHWTNKWADLLQVNRKFLGIEGAKLFRKWIRDNIADNTPYDKFAYSILTASGSNKENPAASYFKILRTPHDTMENTTHLFLGVRFSCNKCHDHPFERWSHSQYYEIAAYFAQFGLKKDPASGKKEIGRTAVERGKPLYEIVFDKNDGEIYNAGAGGTATPRFPYPVKYEAPKGASRREHVARWITSKNNQYFARSYVNRLWGYLLGKGFIEPLDDIRAGNPPTNPELLDKMTDEFVASGFDVRRLLRTICKSRTYQMSLATNRWNEDDKINYSHAMARRLPAEVLYDAIHRVTGSISNIPGVPPGTRAALLPDAGVSDPDGFLAKFGRPPRESACECERATGVQFGPVMAMVTGPTLGNAISDPKNAIAKLVAAEEDDAKVVNALFMRILNRPATEAEIKSSVAVIRNIPREHQRLAAELLAYEKSLAPQILKQEKLRQAGIAKAESELKAYEKQIASREANLDRQQKERIARAEAALKQYEKTLPSKLAAWEARKDQQTRWIPLEASQLSATSATTLVKQKDLSVLAKSSNGRGAYKFVAPTDLTGITAVRLETFSDASLPKKGPGRAPDGNFVLSEFELTAAPKGEPGKIQKIKLKNAQADFSQRGYDVATAIDGIVRPVGNGWAISPKTGVNHQAAFETKQKVGFPGGTILTFTLKQQFQSGHHSIGRFRISVTTSTTSILLKGPPVNIAKILSLPLEKRSDKQRTALLNYFRGVDGNQKKLQQAVALAKKPRPIDAKLTQFRQNLENARKPSPVDLKLAQLRRDVDLSYQQLAKYRLTGAQDIAWALINSSAFLFNR